MEVGPNGRIILYDPQKPQNPGRAYDCTYAFDSSHSESEHFASQSAVYESIGAGMVKDSTAGYNCCLVAYGQTGTGKTHTIHGDWQNDDQEGILPRMAEGLFERLRQLAAEGASWRVRISYIEVYNNSLRDLCAGAATDPGEGQPRIQPPVDRVRSTRSESPSSRRTRRSQSPANAGNPGGRLVIHTHPVVGVYVDNLQEMPVDSFKEVAKVVAEGEKAKRISATTMNDRSSRSHTIFSFKVEIRNAGGGGQSLSTIQVVDLAGRENEQTSDVQGDQFKELTFINRSLFDLASCVNALCDGSRDHVPFRNSKLTMLLSESFSANSRTCLLATLTPSPLGYEENLLTCRFLESTGRIRTQPVQSRFTSEEFQGQLRDEIDLLRLSLGFEDPLLASREVLLQRFSLVWADDASLLEGGDRDPAELQKRRATKASIVKDACDRVAQHLDGAEATLERLSAACGESAASLNQVDSRLASLEVALQQLQVPQAGKAYSPASTARSSRSGRGDDKRLPPLPPSSQPPKADPVKPAVKVSVELPPIEFVWS